MLKNLISICVLIGMIVGGINYFASAEDLAKTNLTIQQMKETYQLDKDIARFKFLDDEIFRLKEKYRNKVMPDETKNQVHKYQQEYKELERKLK